MTKLKIINSELPLKLSATALGSYEQCPRKWYFTYLDKPKVKKKDWSHLILGNFVHRVLEVFHDVFLVSPDLKWGETMVKSIVQTKEEKEFKDAVPSDVMQVAKEILKAYLEHIAKTGMPMVVENERSFEVYLDEKTVIRGKIDRVDRDGRESIEHLILDYKSGKSKYLDPFQLMIYGIPLMDKNPEIEAYRASYLMLKEDMKSLPYTITRTDVNRTRDEIISTANQMRADSTWEPRPQFLCKWCDYAEVCDAFTSYTGYKHNAPRKLGEIGWD